MTSETKGREADSPPLPRSDSPKFKLLVEAALEFTRARPVYDDRRRIVGAILAAGPELAAVSRRELALLGLELARDDVGFRALGRWFGSFPTRSLSAKLDQAARDRQALRLLGGGR